MYFQSVRRHCHFDMAKIAVIVSFMSTVSESIYIVCRVWGEGMQTLCVRRLMLI